MSVGLPFSLVFIQFQGTKVPQTLLQSQMHFDLFNLCRHFNSGNSFHFSHFLQNLQFSNCKLKLMLIDWMNEIEPQEISCCPVHYNLLLNAFDS